MRIIRKRMNRSERRNPAIFIELAEALLSNQGQKISMLNKLLNENEKRNL